MELASVQHLSQKESEAPTLLYWLEADRFPAKRIARACLDAKILIVLEPGERLVRDKVAEKREARRREAFRRGHVPWQRWTALDRDDAAGREERSFAAQVARHLKMAILVGEGPPGAGERLARRIAEEAGLALERLPLPRRRAKTLLE